MKFIDEYRDAKAAEQFAHAIARITTRPWTIMEVCGGQTHAIVRFGVDELLPKKITLVHGPGCPVCVTPVELIDKGIEIAERPKVIFCSFGDMLRVPGTKRDLLSVKAAGGDVRIVYSPLDAVKIAAETPQREVVFFAVGFETTAPANAMAVYQSSRLGLHNFSVLVSHVLVPPAMEAILSSPNCLCRASWQRGMFAALWVLPSTSRSHGGTACRLLLPALSPSTSCKVFTCASSSSKAVAPKSRTNTRAPCAAVATSRRSS
jgi:hydrogenase expression/formation protein HypD